MPTVSLGRCELFWSEAPDELAAARSLAAPVEAPSEPEPEYLDEDVVDEVTGELLQEGLPYGVLTRHALSLDQDFLRGRIQDEDANLATRLVAAVQLWKHPAARAEAEGFLAGSIAEAPTHLLPQVLETIRRGAPLEESGRRVPIGATLGAALAPLLAHEHPAVVVEVAQLCFFSRVEGLAAALFELIGAERGLPQRVVTLAGLRHEVPGLLERVAEQLRGDDPEEAISQLRLLIEHDQRTGRRAAAALSEWLRGDERLPRGDAPAAVYERLWSVLKVLIAHQPGLESTHELCRLVVALPPDAERDRYDLAGMRPAAFRLLADQDALPDGLVPWLQDAQLAGYAAHFCARGEPSDEVLAALMDLSDQAQVLWHGLAAIAATIRLRGEVLDGNRAALAELERRFPDPHHASFGEMYLSDDARAEVEWRLRGLDGPSVAAELAAAGLCEPPPAEVWENAFDDLRFRPVTALRRYLEEQRLFVDFRSVYPTDQDFVALLGDLAAASHGAFQPRAVSEGWLYELLGEDEPWWEDLDEDDEEEAAELEAIRPLLRYAVQFMHGERLYRLIGTERADEYSTWTHEGAIQSTVDRVLEDAGSPVRLRALHLRGIGSTYVFSDEGTFALLERLFPCA